MHNGHGAFVKDLLVDGVVGVGKGGDLREVGHADYLVVLREHPQLGPDDVAALPADPGVNFIKNEGWGGVG